MTEITYELTRVCTTCQATINVSSKLGENFKLSRSKTRERDLQLAASFISKLPSPPKGVNFNPFSKDVNDPFLNVPERLRPYIEATWNPIANEYYFTIIDTPTRYITCPLCKSKIWIY